MVRGHGYVRSASDIGDIVLASSMNGVPIHVRDVGEVILGPDIRRGVADWNGTGDAVSGIVVMRQGENALAVIEARQGQAQRDRAGAAAGRADRNRLRTART